jgi:hypothetical protein
MKIPVAAALAVALPIAAAGCGTARPHRVPDLVGVRLDVAEAELDTVGLRYRTVGGGLFGIVVRSNWVVCGELPNAGATARAVTLVVARSCIRRDGGLALDGVGRR